jgi:hypothetical protein
LSNAHPTVGEALGKLVGTTLSSIDFVEDYMQLRWTDSFLNAFTMPSVVAAGENYCPGHPEYKPNVYRLEGRVLKHAAVIDDEGVNLLLPVAYSYRYLSETPTMLVWRRCSIRSKAGRAGSLDVVSFAAHFMVRSMSSSPR